MKELNIYKFGSRVYGSDDELSDNDLVIVSMEEIKTEGVDKWFTPKEFQSLLDQHDIQALECYFLRENCKINEYYTFDFELNLQKLRPAISTIVSNSWVKGKKKITVMGDYDLRAGLKSIFHSFRILEFGIQIATNGYITDYSCCNWILDDLKKMSTVYTYNELWKQIETKYKDMHNRRSSHFKKLAPKDTSEKDKRRTIFKILLKNHNLSEEDCEQTVNEIMSL